MTVTLLLGLSLLGAEAPKKSPEPDPAKASAAAKPGAGALDPAEALAKYNEMRDRTPDTAAAQWKLATWCEQNHLDAEAVVHFTNVVRLDPSRDAAWRKLGYKRVQGRWLTDEQAATEAEQAREDKEWALKLKKIHRNVHGGKKQAEALAAVAEIDDPHAVRAVYREFGAGGASDQAIAVQILGQINTPLSSKVLAVLAVYGKTAEVRRVGTETLRGRNPAEYLPALVNLMTDPIKYEVKPVGGPGSPGVLFVEGERANLRRFYAAPAPRMSYQPGDIVSFDENGLPAVIHPLIHTSALVQTSGRAKTGLIRTYADQTVASRVTGSQLVAESQKAAITSQAQLQNDVDGIKTLNDAKESFNEHVMNVAKNASGEDHGREPKQWRIALAGKGLYGKEDTKTPPRPTIDEVAPPAYVPNFAGELAFLSSFHTTASAPDN